MLKVCGVQKKWPMTNGQQNPKGANGHLSHQPSAFGFGFVPVASDARGADFVARN